MYGTGDAYIFVFIESGCRIWSGFNWGKFPIIYQRCQISLLVSTMAWPAAGCSFDDVQGPGSTEIVSLRPNYGKAVTAVSQPISQ